MILLFKENMYFKIRLLSITQYYAYPVVYYKPLIFIISFENPEK